MPITEKYLSYILAFLMPGLIIINISVLKGDGLVWDSIFAKWIIASLAIIGLWTLNAFFITLQNLPIFSGNKYLFYLFIFIVNAAYANLFLTLQFALPPRYTFGLDTPWWLLNTRLILVSIIFLTIQLGFQATRQNKALEMANLNLQSENVKSQFELLKQQVNPHFLFNSLSTLRTMIRNQDQRSEEYVLKLSEVYRRVLSNKEEYVVSLAKELNFLEDYLYMLKIRHQKSLVVEINVQSELLQKQLPAFALQLLTENCMKHNIASESRPLHIKIYHPDHQSLRVENNYQPKDSLKESTGLGLSNLEKRYSLLQIEKGLIIYQDQEVFRASLKLF